MWLVGANSATNPFSLCSLFPFTVCCNKLQLPVMLTREKQDHFATSASFLKASAWNSQASIIYLLEEILYWAIGSINCLFFIEYGKKNVFGLLTNSALLILTPPLWNGCASSFQTHASDSGKKRGSWKWKIGTCICHGSCRVSKAFQWIHFQWQHRRFLFSTRTRTPY